MDNLFNEVYQELQGTMLPGHEYILHVEAYEAGTHMAGWHERRTVQSDNYSPTLGAMTTPIALALADSGGALKYHEQCRWYEYDVYLPMLGSDTAETPDTLAEVKTMVDQVVPKVETTSPLADWTISGTDVQLGDTDTALIYQMGKLSLDLLTNPGTVGGIIRKNLKWGGLIWGNAIRYTDTVAVLQEKSVQFNAFNVIFPTPSLIVHMMGIPADFDAEEWDAEATYFPVGGRFERLRFNAPRENKLTGALSILPSTENDARRWFTAWRTTGERQLVQKKLRTTRYYQHVIIRDGSMMPKVLEDTTPPPPKPATPPSG